MHLPAHHKDAFIVTACNDCAGPELALSSAIARLWELEVKRLCLQELPFERPPLFDRIADMSSGLLSDGLDGHLLLETRLKDLHPASWSVSPLGSCFFSHTVAS